jgi:hypothetical protein
MRLVDVLWLLAFMSTAAFGFYDPIFDPIHSVGSNLVTEFTVEYLGTQVSDNTCAHRELINIGTIAGKWYSIFGDTHWCKPGIVDLNMDTLGYNGMVPNSIAELTSDPLRVHDINLNSDFPVSHPLAVISFNVTLGENQSHRFKPTGIVETELQDPHGVLFFTLVTSHI